MGYPFDPVTDQGTELPPHVEELMAGAHQSRAAHDQHGQDAVNAGPPGNADMADESDFPCPVT